MSTTTEKFVRDMLLKGRSIDFVTDASGYPRQEVARILQALREERGQGESTSQTLAPSPADVPHRATPPADNSPTIRGQSADNSGTVTESDDVPETDARSNGQARSLPEMREQARKIVQPRPEFNARTTNAVELLARAANIEDRRIQAALGRARKAMTDLAAEVNRYESKHETRARIAELEEELRALKAEARGGKVSKQPPAYSGEPLACRKGCGRTSPNPQGRSAHERFCDFAGDASQAAAS